VTIKYIEEAFRNNKYDFDGKYVGDELNKIINEAKIEEKYKNMGDIEIIDKLFQDESNCEEAVIKHLKSIYISGKKQ